jgi:type I restriction enzyme S subunit
MEAVNLLPSGWRKQSLRDLAAINYGKSPIEILSNDGRIPVVGTGGVERYGTDWLHEGESIILGRKGTIDKVAYVNAKFWAIDTAYYLSGFNDVAVKWLYYFLQSVDFRLMNEATGVPSLSRDFLYRIEIPTPTKEEQTQIAAILSTIDKAIEQTEIIIAKQQRIKTGLMQDLLTRGIDEHGNIRSEETHAFKDSPLGRIPVEWKVVTLSEVAASAVDGPFGSNLKTEHYVDEPGVRVIRLQNIGIGDFIDDDKAWLSPEHAKKLQRHTVTSGDLLVASLGDERHPFGRACRYPKGHANAVVKADCFRIRLRPSRATTIFIAALLNLPQWRRGMYSLAQGVTRDRVNLTNLMQLAVPLPPLSEQEDVAKLIEAVDQGLADTHSEMKKLQALKTGLIQDLLTGKVRVTELLKKSKEQFTALA